MCKQWCLEKYTRAQCWCNPVNVICARHTGGSLNTSQDHPFPLMGVWGVHCILTYMYGSVWGHLVDLMLHSWCKLKYVTHIVHWMPRCDSCVRWYGSRYGCFFPWRGALKVSSSATLPAMRGVKEHGSGVFALYYAFCSWGVAETKDCKQLGQLLVYVTFWLLWNAPCVILLHARRCLVGADIMIFNVSFVWQTLGHESHDAQTHEAVRSDSSYSQAKWFWISLWIHNWSHEVMSCLPFA